MRRSRMTIRAGRFKMTVTEVHDDSPRVHDYGLTVAEWRRAAAFVERMGPEAALWAMNERAERALDRDDLPTCMRWRSLMAGVHAIANDEPLPGERVH